MKFKKITRAASEFLILSILMEKKISHPYEIHQTLKERIAGKKDEISIKLETLVEFGEEITSFFEKAREETKGENEISQRLENIRSPSVRVFLQKILNEGKTNPQLRRNLKKLTKDASKILREKQSELEAWQKAPAIYQVLNSLEKRNLIKFSGNEKYQGKNRKLYKITGAGIEEAFNMLTTFGELNKLIIPAATIFQNHINLRLKNHAKIASEIMGSLYPDKQIREIISDIEKFDPEFLLELQGLFPIFSNDSLFIPFLFEKVISANQIDSFSINKEQQELFKSILLKKLISYNEQINAIIKRLKD